MQSDTGEEYFRAELLYAHVLELVNHHREVDTADAMGDEDERERRGIMVAELLLTLAETERLVRNPIGTQDASHGALTDGNGEDGASTLLGLSPALLRRAVGMEDERMLKTQQENARQALLPRIEERLRAQCTELCDIMMPTLVAANKSGSAQQLQEMVASVPTTAGGTLSRIAELPALLLDLKARKKKLLEETATATNETHAQLVVAVARVKEMIALISQVLVGHKQNDQARVLQVKLQWLASFSNAMRVEAQVLANRLTVETYPREQIQVLRATGEALQKRRARALEERDELQTRLQLYRDADPEYQAIVQEYGVVLRNIEEKKCWLQSLDV